MPRGGRAIQNWSGERLGVITWQKGKPDITETFTDDLVVNQSQMK